MTDRDTTNPGGGPVDPLTGKPLPEAIPAATLVVYRDRDDGQPADILFVQRSSRMAFAAGAVVFPGGRVDAGDVELAQELAPNADTDTGADTDDIAARIAAIRETIEETGIATAIDGDLSPPHILRARDRLNGGEAMGPVCAAMGWTLRLDELTPFTRWRPPFAEKRVFDTRFYLVRHSDPDAMATVDATENTHLFWASAAEVLRRADADEVKIIFPTRRNLERLAQYATFDDMRDDARRHPATLISPQIGERDGATILSIPEGLGYPVTYEAFETAKRG